MAEWRGDITGPIEGRLRKAAGDGLETVARGAVTVIQSRFLSGQSLNVQTGSLRRSISQETNRDSLEAKVGPLANSPATKYARIHEFGGEIRPKNAKALRFKIGDQWITTQVVRMPARPYLRPGTAQAVRKADEAMARSFKREFGQ